MFVLGLQGSPRKKGNTADLLKRVLGEAEKRGATTHSVEVARKNIRPLPGIHRLRKKRLLSHRR